jgi:hypothetical protein
MAKQQQRRAPPQYADRVYDSVSRATPTLLERRLFWRLLAAHSPLPVREAARLVAWFRRQPGGLSGQRPARSGSSSSGSRRGSGERTPHAGAGGAAALQATAAGTRTVGGLLGRLLGGGGSGGSGEDASLPGLPLHTGDPAAALPEDLSSTEAARAELLPPSDGEIMDLMADMMAEAAATAAAAAAVTAGAVMVQQQQQQQQQQRWLMPSAPPLLNLNTALAYMPELGFLVAVDGAMRLSRPLPAACITSASPPGSLYADHPYADEGLRLTLDYDLDAPLCAPRWLDGYQAYA